MEGIALLIWMLIAVAVPIFLIVVGLIKYKRQAEIRQLVFRFLLAVLTYIFATFCSIMFLFGLMGAIEPSLSKAPGLREKLLYFVVVLLYGAIGWLLCFFVYSSSIKTQLTYNKPQSIFNNNNE